MAYSSSKLHSDRLEVDVSAPGSAYHRTRFDWTGFITQVRLDGTHTFCVPEDFDPNKGSGGIGLCSEFGIEKTIGFEEAQPGETFLKPGIGLLTRPDDAPYNFFRDYPIATPFEIKVEESPSQVRFEVEPADCRGYALRQSRTVSVEHNYLTIANTLENTGSRAIHTHEYTHNFTGIDHMPTGPDYVLRFSFPVVFEPSARPPRRRLPPAYRFLPFFVLDQMMRERMGMNNLRVSGPEIRWKAAPRHAFYCRPTGFSQTEQATWELVYEPDEVGMREYDDFAPARIVLWGAEHVISPEVFVDIDLEPGEKTAWSRRYEFVA